MVPKAERVTPPVEPMLAKTADELPLDGDFLFEPKWDGFRAIVFRSKDDVYIQSRDLRPLDRYFPELHAVLLEQLPSGVVVDGEIVMPTKHGLDFGGLQMRLHPAASRVAMLAKATPAAYVSLNPSVLTPPWPLARRMSSPIGRMSAA
jgi:ATP-dependent DNA ligase